MTLQEDAERLHEAAEELKRQIIIAVRKFCPLLLVGWLFILAGLILWEVLA